MTNKKILTLITLLLLVSFLLVGCELFPPKNHVPVITTTALPDATVGTAYTTIVEATDADGDDLTFSMVSGPTGMEISEAGVISGWTPDEVGTEAVKVAVTDGIETVSADFTITVNEFVVELVGIEVVPEEMTLVVDGIEDFKVTADYNNGSTADVTLECVYGIDDISIATVVAGTVTAEAVGTATISISYEEGGITKGTTLTVIVKGTVTINWLEDAKRYNADGSQHGTWETAENSWINDPNGPATLIKDNGGYYFADVNQVYNVHGDLLDFSGAVTISETGAFSGHTTYYLYGLLTENDFEGQVEIIVYEDGISGTMVGTYTQLKYAYGTINEVKLVYPAAIQCEGSEIKWFVQYTDYIAHEEVPSTP